MQGSRNLKKIEERWLASRGEKSKPLSPEKEAQLLEAISEAYSKKLSKGKTNSEQV